MHVLVGLENREPRNGVRDVAQETCRRSLCPTVGG